MLKRPIAITSYASISPLGSNSDEVWRNYLNPKTFIESGESVVANLNHKDQSIIKAIAGENSKYKSLDASVLYAMFAAREALRLSPWEKESVIGINIGSSRGATDLFEKYHTAFLRDGQTQALSSPTTTLGNISSWLANDLQVEGPVISHSITCSTALHSFLNGIAWINGGMSAQFMVGGSEAANTAFTIAQMKALKIYAQPNSDAFPCRSLDFNKQSNTMVLGEGAAVFCLESNSPKPNVAKIIGYGYATELVDHNASISTNADCFQKSIRMALKGLENEEVDAIIMHAPGTIQGDLSELNAIQSVFGENHPALTSNKWKIGHSLGASGAFSVELAILMLKHQTFIESPFYNNPIQPKRLNKILVNAVGFGGNAVSLLISI